MPDVRGCCPACSAQALSLRTDGVVLCAAPCCPDPAAVNYLLHGGDPTLVALLGGGARGRVLAQSLAADGITCVKLSGVTDAELDRVPGINPTVAARIREAFPAASQQEIAHLRAGEESGYTPENEPTPGQWLWRLHQAPAGERLEVISRLLESNRRAEQLQELLRVANETSNRSESERANAVARASQALAAIARVQALHRPVDYRGLTICAECSGFDGQTCDNSPCGYEHCPTLAAIGETSPRLLDCGLCYEERGEEVHPHPECPAGKSDVPLVGFARIGVRVEPGFVDGVTAASWSKDAILSDADSALMPDVDIKGARSLPLKGSRQVFAGDEQAQIFVDGRRYTTSSAHPVIVEPFGPGDAGAFVTLTLIADKVTVDGKEISE